jgi:flagellar protein FlgJ
MTGVTCVTASITSDKEAEGMSTKTERLAFVTAVYPAAYRLYMAKDSIHPVFVTAQAAIETGWKVKGAEGTNNLFGITRGSSWRGEVKLCLTTEHFATPDKRFTAPERVVSVTPEGGGRYAYRVYRLFRVYDSPEACLNDHLSVLRGAGYADAWPYRNDPKAFAAYISNSVGAKYATAPTYVDTMCGVIDMVERYVKELGL